MRNFDAVVIGAGPAGSTAALALARQGFSVALVERAAFPRKKVCGEFLSAANAALLDRLGVGEAWRARAGPEVRRVALFCGKTAVDAPMPQGTGFGRALGRDVLDGLLLEAARQAGAEVFQPARAVGLVRSEAGKAVLVEGGEGIAALSAPVVIAAHGSWEPGKLPTQLPKRHGPRDLLGFKAHFRAARLAGDLMPLLAFPGGYGGMVWADDGRLSLSLCIRRDALGRIRARFPDLPAGDAVERHVRTKTAGVDAALRGAALDGRWHAAGPIRPGIRPRHADGVFAVGNVAGESHPIIAEGISMAIQSAWLLAAELSCADFRDPVALDAAGRAYAGAWRKQFAVRIQAASLLAALAAGPGGRLLMTMAVGVLPAALTWGARLSGKSSAVPGLG